MKESGRDGGEIDFHAALKQIPLEVWITSEKGTEAKKAGHLKGQRIAEKKDTISCKKHSHPLNFFTVLQPPSIINLTEALCDISAQSST